MHVFKNPRGLIRLGLLFVLLVSYTSSAKAQETASISGYVLDADSGESMLLANLRLEGTTIGTATNAAGYFALTRLPAGEYTLVCSYIGYLPYSRQISLQPGQEFILEIELRPDDTELGELVVESEREKEAERNIGVTKLDVQTIQRIPAVLQADVFRSLQLLPGIKAASDFSSGLYIRGGSPDQTLIMLDHTTVYNPTHVFGFFSTFNPDAIKDVRLFKGGYPAEYGGRLGSVLDMYNKEGNRNRLAGVVSVGLLSSRVSIENPTRTGSWMLAGRRSTLEPVLAVLKSQLEDQNIPDSFYFYDFNGKLNVDLSRKNKLSAGFYAGQDFVDLPISDDSEIALRYGNLTGNVNWTHIFSPEVYSHFTFTGSRYFSYPKGTFASTEFKRENTVLEWSAKGDFEVLPSNERSYKAGFWAGRMAIDLVDTFNGQQGFTSDIDAYYAAGYVQHEWRPNVRWVVTGGLRANYFSDGNYLRLDPRISADYTYSEKLRLQAAYGRYHQFLSLITNEAFSGFDVWVTSDEGVKPSYGDQYVVGVKTRPVAGFGLDVEAYYRDMKDLFEFDPFIPDIAGLAYADLFRVGDGYAYGVEVFLEKSMGRLTGFAGYTWGRTRRRFPNYNNNAFYPPKYDRTHDVQLVASYNLSKKWSLTAAFSYATGQAFTQPLGRTLIENPFGEVVFGNSEGDVLTVGNLNASRLPPYHRLDVGATRTGRFFGRADSELQLQLINAYSRRNIWFYQYDFDENPAVRDDVLQLPILPNIAYTIRF